MPGQYQCDNYLRPVFTLTNTEMLFRTFAVLSTLLMAISLILMLIGLDSFWVCDNRELVRYGPGKSESLERHGKYENTYQRSYCLYQGEYYETGCSLSFPRWLYAFV